MKVLNLQMFADLDSILESNAEAFEGTDIDIKDSFNNISAKLSELGYEVLINNKKQAEFIPAGRLSEVVSQRDSFKAKVEELNTQLEQMKANAQGNDKLQGEIQKLMDQNNALLQDLEETRINAEIMVAAKDAINAKDLLVFINRENIKVNAKGEILGVDAEIERLREEKPYLFQTEEGKRKFGTDNKSDGDKGGQVSGMNSMIRRAAGRLQF